MKKWMYFLSFLFVGFTIEQPVEAQILRKKKVKTQVPSKKGAKDKYEEKIKGAEKMEGLFTLYRDKDKGNLYLELTEDQLNKEYIHFSYIENGVTDARAVKGSYRGSKIIER